MPGFSFGYWGTQFSRNVTWWPYSLPWHRYLARCHYLLQQGLPVADVLAYLRGLKPTDLVGAAFGSYGWAKGGARDVEEYLKAMKFEILREPLQVQFVPTPEVLLECRAAGELLAQRALAAKKESDDK